jgi:hypothetical protein
MKKYRKSVGLGRHTKGLIVEDAVYWSALNPLAKYNNTVLKSTNELVLELKLNLSILLEGVTLGSNIVLYDNLYYYKYTKNCRLYKDDGNTNAKKYEYAINNNLYAINLFNKFCVEVIREFVEAGNFKRVSKLISAAVVLGASYNYLHKQLIQY